MIFPGKGFSLSQLNHICFPNIFWCLNWTIQGKQLVGKVVTTLCGKFCVCFFFFFLSQSVPLAFRFSQIIVQSFKLKSGPVVEDGGHGRVDDNNEKDDERQNPLLCEKFDQLEETQILLSYSYIEKIQQALFVC